MKNKEEEKTYQLRIAKVLYEMGMDFDVITKVSGVEPFELLFHCIKDKNIVDNEEEKIDNKLD